MTYKVKTGDTLSKIAKRNGITLAQLLQANPNITNPNKIKVGQAINVPDASGTNNKPAAADDKKKPAPAKPKPTVAPTAAPVAAAVGAAVGVLGAAIADALGSLSAKYETGGRGPGTVSSGKGDPGGVSYGSYQMATNRKVPQRFVKQDGFPWLTDFKGLTAGTPPFTKCWKRIAAEQPDPFQRAQHAFIKKTHYDLLCAKVLKDDGLDVNTRHPAVQDVVWSTAVQLGGATPVVHRAIAKVTVAKTDPSYDEQLIRAIYAERGRKRADGKLAYFASSKPNVQKGVANRFKNELQDALAMLAKEV